MGKARKEKGGQEAVEGSWCVERSDEKGSSRGQGCEEEDKGLKAETDGVWGRKASSRSLLGSLILGSSIPPTQSLPPQLLPSTDRSQTPRAWASLPLSSAGSQACSPAAAIPKIPALKAGVIYSTFPGPAKERSGEIGVLAFLLGSCGS